MKKINLAISGCLGRMGQQLIKSSKINKDFKLTALTENKAINKKIGGIKLDINTEQAFKKTDVITFLGSRIIYITPNEYFGCVKSLPNALINELCVLRNLIFLFLHMFICDSSQCL